MSTENDLAPAQELVDPSFGVESFLINGIDEMPVRPAVAEPCEIVGANNAGLPTFGGAEGDYARAKVEYNAKRAREEGKLVDEKERVEIRTEAARAREQNAAAKVYLETKKQDQDEK